MGKVYLLLISSFIFFGACNVGNRKTEKIEQDSVKKFTVTEVWRTDSVLLTPESVIYDKKRDIIYVSCMNLEPRLKDKNGFISKIDKNGKITELRWIEGMNSPKGLAIIGDTLYAADIDEVVVMDIEKGVITRTIPVKGARMLNDITADNEGNLYISDTDDSKIHIYSGGSLSKWLGDEILGPNGLLFHNDTMFVASQGENNFSAIDIKTKSLKILTDSIAHADGIAYSGIPGYFIVSDWNGEVFVVNPDFSKTSVLDTKEVQINSADIDFIQDEKLLIIPTFFKNMVIGYRLEVAE